MHTRSNRRKHCGKTRDLIARNLLWRCWPAVPKTTASWKASFLVLSTLPVGVVHQNPHTFRKYWRNSPELNVRCAPSCHGTIWLFFQERAVASTECLDLLEFFAVP
jgi:hypothetical protein